jgi:hypothetical protein
LEIDLTDQEERVVGRLLTEREARLIEITEDTTIPDGERRGGSIELLVVASTLRKLHLQDAAATGPANALQNERARRDARRHNQ